MRRASRHADCTDAPPKPISVTQLNPADRPPRSSLSIASAAPFHSGLRRVLRLPLAATKYPPHPPPCEPHANWAFAKALVAATSVTRTSHRRDLTTPATRRGRRGGHLRSRHGTADAQREHDRDRHRGIVGHRGGDRTGVGATRPWLDLGGAARRPLEGIGRRVGTGPLDPRRGHGGRPHRADSRGELPAQLEARGPARRHPGQQRWLHDDGPGVHGRPRRRARVGAHQRRSGRRPVHAVRARHGHPAPRRGAEHCVDRRLPAVARTGRLRRVEGLRALLRARPARRAARHGCQCHHAVPGTGRDRLCRGGRA